MEHFLKNSERQITFNKHPKRICHQVEIIFREVKHDRIRNIAFKVRK